MGKTVSLQTRLQLTSATLLLVTAAITATGYVRELALASLFGAGAEMDAFYFSLGLVQALHDLVFAGALGATIVPLLHLHDAGSRAGVDGRARIVVTVTLVVAVLAGTLALVLWLGMPYIIEAIAPRMSQQGRTTSTAFAMVPL